MKNNILFLTLHILFLSDFTFAQEVLEVQQIPSDGPGVNRAYPIEKNRMIKHSDFMVPLPAGWTAAYTVNEVKIQEKTWTERVRNWFSQLFEKKVDKTEENKKRDLTDAIQASSSLSVYKTTESGFRGGISFTTFPKHFDLELVCTRNKGDKSITPIQKKIFLNREWSYCEDRTLGTRHYWAWNGKAKGLKVEIELDDEASKDAEQRLYEIFNSLKIEEMNF